jgi:hypothetical protein
MFIFEGVGAGLEAIGFLFIIASYALDLMSPNAFVAFMMLAIGMGLLQSAAVILLEQMTFNTYPKTRQLLLLMLVIIVENFGYRQLNSLWRMIGLYKWVFQYKSVWGEMVRTASWAGKVLEIADSKKQKAIHLSTPKAIFSSLQTKATGTSLLREKHNRLFKTESKWGETAVTTSQTGKTLDAATLAKINSEKQKSM